MSPGPGLDTGIKLGENVIFVIFKVRKQEKHIQKEGTDEI
jgi:hypothetical protein